MSFAIDLREHGSDLKKLYEGVISSDPETRWAILEYDGASSALKPGPHGSGDLDDFVDAFDDARIQYGLVRVDFNNVNKIVLVGWVGENVSARQRLTFNAHMSAVAKQFPGHHIQITARSSDELTPAIILEKVNAAAGSKYAGSTKPAPATKPKYIQAKEGANEDDWVEVEPVEERDLTVSKGSDYKSSVREELEQLRKGKKPLKAKESQPAKAVSEDEDEDEKPSSSSRISGLNSGTSYTPVGKIDLKKIREEAKGSKFADARIEKIEPSYKPVGKVDLKAIREQARKEKELKAKKEAGQVDDKPAPKSAPKFSAKEQDSESEPESEPEKKPEPKKSRPVTSGDDDEPQFASLADRMKAFQNSVSGAKPKYEVSSSNSRPSGLRSGSSRTTKQAEPRKSQDKSDSEDDAPLSVAAQLAKSRLAESKKSDDDVPPPAPKRESAPSSEPKSNVSTFAARFAKQDTKQEKPESESEEEEEEEEEESRAPPTPGRSARAPEAPVLGKVDKNVDGPIDLGITAVVTQAYPSGDDDEISLNEGDLIVHIQKVDENWWIGENPSGAVGLFPKDYVRLEENSDKEATPEPANEESESVDEGKIAIAQYSYEAGDSDELSFEENEKIIEVDFPSEDWWSGKNSRGDFGLFPSSYVKLQ